jgi:hypothetical protein
MTKNYDPIRLPPKKCPHCGYLVTAASAMRGPTPMPKPGDLSVCFGCGEALQFDRRLRLAKITAAELAALGRREAAEFHRVQREVRRFLETRGGEP